MRAPADSAALADAPTAAESLRAEGLCRSFGAARVVQGAAFSLRPGELTALVGPSGCGKTTLLQMLGLLERPDAGRVLLDGQDAWALPAPARAELRLRRLGFVFQQRNLLDHLTALQNAALPAWRLCGSREQAERRARAALERVGLSHRAEARAGRLSVGEGQRVALARALVNGPALILADEPTGALDSQSAATVLDALEAATRTGAALLVVTHDAAVAARASRVLHMRDGRVEG